MPQASKADDPTPVILARLEVKLDTSLETQKAHGSLLESLGGRIDRVENRMTVLETKHSTENAGARIGALEKRMYVWVGASAVLASAGSVLLPQILT